MTDLLLCDQFLATPGRFLWHPPTATAVLSDLHLGFEREMARRGNYLPDFTAGPLAAAWAHLLGRHPRQIILAGDVFHGGAPDAATVEQACWLFRQANCSITLLAGNHDPALATLRSFFESLPVTVANHAAVAGWSVCHGHTLGGLEVERGLIVGHQHPAVTFASRVQSAKMICFAAMTVRLPPPTGERPLILLPAFSPVSLGSNLLTARYWFVDCPLPPFDQIRIAGIVGDQVLDFGPLDRL